MLRAMHCSIGNAERRRKAEGQDEGPLHLFDAWVRVRLTGSSRWTLGFFFFGFKGGGGGVVGMTLRRLCCYRYPRPSMRGP